MDVQSGPPVPSNPLGKEGWLLAIRTPADALRTAIQAFATPTSATCPDVALELPDVACGFNPCGDRWIRDQGKRPAGPTMRGVVHRPRTRWRIANSNPTGITCTPARRKVNGTFGRSASSIWDT